MRKLPVVLFALAVPSLLMAQSGPIPINSGTVDYITWITNAIDNLVNSSSGVFLTTGNQILTAIGIIMLVIYGLKLAAESASRHHGEFNFPALIQFFGLFLVAEALMRYYNSPLPWTSVSISRILPDTARFFAGTIDLTALNTLLTQISALVSGAEQPGITNITGVILYYLILIDMTLIQGVLFAVNILAFVFIGIGSLLGPIFIPWLIVPRLSFLFWNWVQFMLQYSFYRVVASALTYVWATVLVNFISGTIHGNYTLAHFLVILVPLGVLNIGLLVSVFKIGGVVSDLFKGAATAGSNFVGSVAGVVAGAFR
ncbi:MAG: type IV secretion system protein [Bryobacteraceae bacterium]